MSFADHFAPALASAIADGHPIRVVFNLAGAGPDEAGADILARWPVLLPIIFAQDGSVRSVTVDGGRITFEAPFYSTLGRSAWLSLRLARIVSIQDLAQLHAIAEPPAVAQTKDRRGLTAVRGDA